MPDTPDIAAICADLEEKRQSIFQIFVMAAPMSFALICAIAAMNTREGIFPWVTVGVLTFVVVLIEFSLADHIFRRRTKHALLHRIAEKMGLSYNMNGAFPLESVAGHKIVPPHDSARIEDGFSGIFQTTPIAFQEIVLTDRVKDSKGKACDVLVFQGLLIRMTIGKTLNAHTVIIPRNVALTFFRRMFSSFQPVRLSSVDFQARFDTLSTDPAEAHYILDPAFVEYVMDTARSLNAKNIEISFLEQEILMLVGQQGPLFEIGNLTRALTPASLGAVQAEIALVTSLVERLRLNPYTGLGAVRSPDSAFYPQ